MDSDKEEFALVEVALVGLHSLVDPWVHQHILKLLGVGLFGPLTDVGLFDTRLGDGAELVGDFDVVLCYPLDGVSELLVGGNFGFLAHSEAIGQ